MSNFFQQLEERCKTTLLCVGLDPRSKNATAARAECIELVTSTAPYAAAFKPNAAFFEAFGADGWAALADIIKHINTTTNVPVILDAKRGDIASTAQAYATSAFRKLGAGAITASPYMGHDSLAPFLSDPRHGAFVLCKTSNNGSNDLQTLPLLAGTGKQLFEIVASVAETKWSKMNRNVGLVVGATDPEAIFRVRAAAPSLCILCPGVGAQGGDLEQSLAAGLRSSDASGMLINVSRGISAAKDPAAVAQQLCKQIEDARAAFREGRLKYSTASNSKNSVTVSADNDVMSTLPAALLKSQCVRFGQFKLKSGLISPIYLDLRRLVSHPDVMRLVAKQYAAVIRKIVAATNDNGGGFDRLCGLPYAALPIATAVSLEMGKPLIYPRREAKEYGTKAAIEGDYKAGERVIIIDDLVTRGDSKMEAIEKLQSVGLKVVAIVVLIDREQGATEYLGQRGYGFEAVARLGELLTAWRASNSITKEQHAQAVEFMRTGGKKQSKGASKL